VTSYRTDASTLKVTRAYHAGVGQSERTFFDPLSACID
jgi:hypothetical protein